MSPLAVADGPDAPGLIDELVPCLAAVVEDVVVGLEDAVRQPVVAHELPDIFDRIELGAFGRQGHDADIVWQLEPVGGVPSGLIDEQHGVRTGRHGLGDFGEVQIHRLGVAKGKDEPGTLALSRTDRAEDVGRGGALVMRRRGACATLGPTPRDLVLLSDPRFVLEPDFYRRVARERRSDLRQRGSEAPFLNASIATSSWAWWRGRADSLA